MYQGFILSARQVTNQNQTGLEFQGRLEDGRRFHWRVTEPKRVFFLNRAENWTPEGASRRPVKLQNLRGQAVDALYFKNSNDLYKARNYTKEKYIPTYEADINLQSRFLMEHFIQGAVAFKSEPAEVRGAMLYFIDPEIAPSDFTPELKMLSLDIECSVENDLYSISLFGRDLERVYMLDPEQPNGSSTEAYIGFTTERALLEACFADLRSFDPDVLVGWNVIGFDLLWLSRKCENLKISFAIGSDAPARMLEPAGRGNQWLVRVPGRGVIDGINMTRSMMLPVDDFSLGTVSSYVLGRKKLIEKSGKDKLQEIMRQFREEKSALARYNLEDSRLVYEIFEKLHFLPQSVRRTQLTGLSFDRNAASVAAFDFLYLPRLHRRGYVADTDPLPHGGMAAPPGGLVLDSAPGFYDNVAILDFKSLYPSIMLTFHVDPLAANIVLQNEEGVETPPLGEIIRGPAGLGFAKDFSILPGIIAELWKARDLAKRAQDGALSYAVKIIMNSFYGVLGSPGCRFYDPRLAGTITRNGHWILTHSREWIEQQGYQVIYGDTDSLFVRLGDGSREMMRDIGVSLAKNLNQFLEQKLKDEFGSASRLEIEFEKLFKRFFMPTIRGSDTGSKKRYAGLLYKDLNAELEETESFYAGMETSRRDWTELAKEFQRHIFSIVFSEASLEEQEERLERDIRLLMERLNGGELDEQLVYRKGLSKPLEEYTANLPPHVKAAKMLDEMDGRVVYYVMTLEGPEPIQKRSGSPLDYIHYAEKQLAPVADMVLRFFKTDFQAITGDGKQLDLF